MSMEPQPKNETPAGAAPSPQPLASSGAAGLAGCAAVLGLGIVLGVSYRPSPGLSSTPILLIIAAAGAQTAIAIWLARHARLHFPPPRAIVLAAFAAACILAMNSVSVWPNSGDEYGYVYLARTLMAGRLWNQAAPLPGLFDSYWIYDRNGVRLSQYAPGWPALLTPFIATGTEALASPLALLATGALLVASLRLLAVPAAGVAALAALVLLTPFVLFNGASLFPLTFSGALVLAVCWLQLREDTSPAAANRAAIGLCFSVLLTVRYEIFVLLLACYGIDRIWRRRARFAADLPALAAGAAPLTAALLAYNWAITGSPFQLTYSWLHTSQGLGLYAMGDDQPHSLRRALWNEQTWFALLCEYGGLALLLLFAVAIVLKIRSKTLRFYDALPFAAGGFFFLFPELGGHQFGPRYWLFAFAPMALTTAALPIDRDGWLLLGGRRLHLPRLHLPRLHLPSLAALQIAGFAAMAVMVGVSFRLYADMRREVYHPWPPAVPATVLIPSRTIIPTPWQRAPAVADSRDFTRNGTDFDAPVLYGRADAPDAIKLACSLPGRAVYLWQDAGHLARIDCRTGAAISDRTGG
jgi:hypothetical protein